MFKISKISICIIISIIILIFNIEIAFSQQNYSPQEIIKKSRIISGFLNYGNCFALKTLTLEEAGFITLHFKHNNFSQSKSIHNYHKNSCPENVLYDVKVGHGRNHTKKTKIIGAKGVNGRTTNKEFWIQVSPETGNISLSILKNQMVATEFWDFHQKVTNLKARIARLKKAEGTTPSWQKAFKNVESKLIEAADKDQTPPKIEIFSPSNNFKVDSYNLFVRGKVVDNEGVMKLIVKGKNLLLNPMERLLLKLN